MEAQPTTTGLHLLVDSTGIKKLGKGEWQTKKHGADYRRQWCKVHLSIDAATLEIEPLSDRQRHQRCADTAVPARQDCRGRANCEHQR